MNQAGIPCPRCQGNVMPRHDLLLCVQCGHITAYIDEQPSTITRRTPRPEDRPMGLSPEQALEIFIDPALTDQWLRATMWPEGPACPSCGLPHPEPGQHHLRCPKCETPYSPITGTPMEHIRAEPGTWLLIAHATLTAWPGDPDDHQLSKLTSLPPKTVRRAVFQVKTAKDRGADVFIYDRAKAIHR